jgi:hypothetical protein
MAESPEEIRKRIHRKAAVRAEAIVYSLNNPYLTTKERAMIEAVYQFPLGVLHYAFAFLVLWSEYASLDAWLLASVISVLAWAIARLLPGRLFWPVGLIFGGNISSLLCLGLAISTAVTGRYGATAYLFLAGFGITSVVEAPMWLWSLSRRMNPKYGIAKRMFGTVFPFETEID